MSLGRVITIGTATLDVFLSGKAIHAKRDVRTYEYIEQFPLGAKIELDRVDFSTGGGATNAAVTFKRQGFSAGVVAKVGDDLSGREVVQSLKNEGIVTNTIAVDLEGTTAYST